MNEVIEKASAILDERNIEHTEHQLRCYYIELIRMIPHDSMLRSVLPYQIAKMAEENIPF